MGKNHIISLKDAASGVLHGGQGVFRILVDEESCGAKNFSLLVNTMNAGAKGSEHEHDVEHCLYFLSGSGTAYIGEKSFEIGPEMAFFIPPNTLHKIDSGGEGLTYVVIYAPPGPEQQLKQREEKAFESL
jgi:mannose-6-phosphate isomerase-like protein (cupin superfamily)